MIIYDYRRIRQAGKLRFSFSKINFRFMVHSPDALSLNMYILMPDISQGPRHISMNPTSNEDKFRYVFANGCHYARDFSEHVSWTIIRMPLVIMKYTSDK